MQQIATFNLKETDLLDRCEAILTESSPTLASHLQGLRSDVRLLSEIANRSPSPNSDFNGQRDGRSWRTLAEKLKNQGIDAVVNLPVKAVVGRSFLVSKLHLFGFLEKVSHTDGRLLQLQSGMEDCYHDILFDLMAEDLYISVISESKGGEPWLHRATEELIRMWDYRTSANKKEFAPNLRKLWSVRHTIVPVLGTLRGTVELMRLSFGLSPMWHSFILSQAKKEGMTHALEEYLFSLSYEQISLLRVYMQEKGIAAISRAQAMELLLQCGETAFEKGEGSSAIQLYHSFLQRQTLAKGRRLTQSKGPHRSLEEYFLIYLWEVEEKEEEGKVGKE
ncbi:hypothetical protein [Sphaerochaeta sp. PS]|uniref:hypothetical protein n=1 Tax=Sphaerochaeta sp. PS TaxID=3076336 RepID=UPI0028A41E89|nr:hypothetical protein [Sphaerochaeta sp. PS]MDT4762005.1 hypothetical protein [Sphaerochaeta sp. PS]